MDANIKSQWKPISISKNAPTIGPKAAKILIKMCWIPVCVDLFFLEEEIAKSEWNGIQKKAYAKPCKIGTV